MSAPTQRAAERRPALGVDALVCRLAGGMALFAAAILLACLVAIMRLPAAKTDGSFAGYAIPGTGHIIDAAIVPVLAWCGGVAALLGCATLVFGALGPGGMVRVTAGRRPGSSRRSLLILAAGALALTAVLLLRR